MLRISLRLVDLNNYFQLCLFLTIKGYKNSFKKGIKVNTKILVNYQSSISMAKRLKQNTFNKLNFSQKGFKSCEEQIGACESQH